MGDDNNTSTTGPPVPAEAGDAGDSDQPRANLGILLVHGIGEQAQGETLTKFAEPIVDWMRDWLHREAAEGSLVASTPVDGALRPPLLLPGTPAHARVVIGAGKNDARVQQWLFAEAWWGPQVLTPSIGSFTMWLVTRGPWLMLFHFNQRLLASRTQHTAWKWLIGVPLTVVWVVLSLLLSAVLVAASLIAVIPIGRVRRAVYAVLRSIAGVVGDAYGQLRSPIQRAAFERATLDAMEWLRPKCETLAVIAHSQGAAIAHRALLNGDPQADLLVTVGAGITKLEALRYLERLGPSDRIAGFLAPLLLVAGGVVALRTRALGLMDVESRFILPATLVIVGLAFLAQVWITVRRSLRSLRTESQRLSLKTAQPALSWMDIVSTHDPVPAGQLKDFFDLEKTGPIESHRISILRSWLADHTSYWTARASFMEVLVPRLAEAARLEFARSGDAVQAGVRSTVAQQRLDRDLKALTVARGLDAIALLIPFIVARDRLMAAVEQLRVVLAGRRAPGVQGAPLRFIEDTITNVEQGLRWTADLVAGDAGTWARTVVNLAVAFVLVALALLAWRRLEFAVWGAWSASRNEKALRGPVRTDGLPKHLVRQARLFAVLSGTLANTAMGATLFMGITVSAAWSFAPAWASESGVYRLLGSIAAGLFVLLMLVGQLVDWLEKFDSLPDRWRGSFSGVTWPSVRTALSRVTEAAIGLLVVWLTIDKVVTLPAILKPEIIFIGVLALLRGFLTILDAMWQRLENAGARTRTKAILLMLPIAIGAAAVAGFSFVPHTEPLQVSGILSGAVVVGCIAAGLIMLALRVVRIAR